MGRYIIDQHCYRAIHSLGVYRVFRPFNFLFMHYNRDCDIATREYNRGIEVAAHNANESYADLGGALTKT